MFVFSLSIDTPKQKVGFTGQIKESKRTVVESTPRRQSKRISSHDATAKLSAAAEDSSPEIEKRSTRKSTSKRPARYVFLIARVSCE